jgi:hypothetical protein
VFDTMGTHLVNCGNQKGAPIEALVASTSMRNSDVQRWQQAADKSLNGEAHDMVSLVDSEPQSPQKQMYRGEQNQQIESSWVRGSGWGCGGSGECDMLVEAVSGLHPFGQTNVVIKPPQMKKSQSSQHTSCDRESSSLSYTRYIRSPFHQSVITIQRPDLDSPIQSPQLQRPLLSQLAKHADPSRHSSILQDASDNSKPDETQKEWDDAACDPSVASSSAAPLENELTYFQKILLVGVNDTVAENQYKRNLESSVAPTLIRDALNKATTTVRDTVRGYGL